MEGFAQVAESLDKELTLAINSLHTPASDAFWTFMSRTAVWVPLYVAVLAFLLYRLGWKRTLVALVTLALTILCVDQFANLIKDAAGRLRPCHDVFMLDSGLNNPVGKGGMYGFFSAHAANAFAFATASVAIFKADRRGNYRLYTAVIFIWAILVSLSRVFLGKHFLGDVLAGAVVGTVFGYVLGLISRKIILRIRAF